MTATTAHPEIQPTLQVVANKGKALGGKFVVFAEKLDVLSNRLGILSNTVEDLIEVTKNGFSRLESRVDGVERAVDKDAITIIDHEERIVVLETKFA